MRPLFKYQGIHIKLYDVRVRLNVAHSKGRKFLPSTAAFKSCYCPRHRAMWTEKNTSVCKLMRTPPGCNVRNKLLLAEAGLSAPSLNATCTALYKAADNGTTQQEEMWLARKERHCSGGLQVSAETTSSFLLRFPQVSVLCTQRITQVRWECQLKVAFDWSARTARSLGSSPGPGAPLRVPALSGCLMGPCIWREIDPFYFPKTPSRTRTWQKEKETMEKKRVPLGERKGQSSFRNLES